MRDVDVNRLLESGPSAQAAFVPAKVKVVALAQTLAALSNGNGGVVLLGVSATGRVQTDNPVGELTAIVEQACLLTAPRLMLPKASVVTTGRGAVVVAEVPSGLPNIYCVDGLYLVRSETEDGQNRPLSTLELRRLMLDRGDAGFEAQTVHGATMADLDAAQVSRYLESLTFRRVDDVGQALLARGCVGYGAEGDALVPTVAGMLLFGRHPQQYLRSAEVICVHYAGDTMSDEFVRQDLHGSLADQIRQTELFVASTMRRGVRLRKLEREESGEYPMAVVREAIVNAIAHRDYSVRGDGIRVFMFSDRLEVYSPGRLPGHVTLSNLVEERYSRNEAIVSVLSDMGYIERLGYGIDRMIVTMRGAGLPTPKFEETSAGFRVTLRSEAVSLVHESAATEWGDVSLNKRQRKALVYVRANERITNKAYQQLAPDVSAETIRRDLADLVERNVLIRIGAKRATYYILK